MSPGMQQYLTFQRILPVLLPPEPDNRVNLNSRLKLFDRNVIAYVCVHAVCVYFHTYNSNALPHLEYLLLNRSESTTLFSSGAPWEFSNQHHSSSVLSALSFKTHLLISYNAASRILNQQDRRHINTYFSLDISHAFQGPWLQARGCIFTLTVSKQPSEIMMPNRHCALPCFYRSTNMHASP